MELPDWADETVAEATGRRHRVDPVLPGGGGPAGNARLTAWTGALLLVLFLIELVTLLDLDGLITWHVVVGVLLVPPALLKTATTGWRIVRYYTGQRDYQRAGPPPMPLRVLGPLVVVGTLAVLGSGLALIALGQAGGRAVLFTVLGQRVDALTIHQATFVVWAVVTGLHCLGRLVPAFRLLTARNPLPGRVSRSIVVVVTVIAAGVAGVVLAGTADSWHSVPHHHRVR